MVHRGPNPSGLCLCGCGQKTSLATRTRKESGHIKGQPINFIQNHRPSGEMSFGWKGGLVKGPGVYARARVGSRYAMEHRLVAEKALGESLPPKARVHHHTPDQLVVCQDDAYHQLLHRRQRALDACGHANWNKCYLCRVFDHPMNLRSSRGGVSSYHPSCINDYQSGKGKKEKNGSE